jgi:hypothetical protein
MYRQFKSLGYEYFIHCKEFQYTYVYIRTIPSLCIWDVYVYTPKYEYIYIETNKYTSTFIGNLNLWDTNILSIVGNFNLRSKIYNARFNAEGTIFCIYLYMTCCYVLISLLNQRIVIILKL